MSSPPRPPDDPARQRDIDRPPPDSGHVSALPGRKRDRKPVADVSRNGGVDAAQPAPETIASRLATRQQGGVKWAQLRDAGVGPNEIRRRARLGHLHRMHRGVYIVGHLALAALAREKAALLACGEGAVIGHWSAAFLHGLTESPPGVVHVNLVGRRCRPKRDVRVHTVSELDPCDVTIRSGIPLTAPARTLIDVAASATEAQLEALVSEARALTLLRDGDLQAALDRAGRRAGVGAMRAFLEDESIADFTRSEAERRMRRLVRAAGLPLPRMNTRIGGWKVDFLWPAQRLVVEVDGYDVHRHRAAFERDRRKGLALAASGFRVIRITWRQLVHEPLFVAAQLAAALAGARG